MRRNHSAILVVVVLIAVTAVMLFPIVPSRGVAAAGSAPAIDPYRAAVPSVDVNATAAGLRKATAAQLAAIDQFKSTYGNQVTIRWNSFAGSPDVIRGFHTGPSTGTAESVARSFVGSNSTLFGVDPSALVLVDQKEALGGYLVKFQQTSNGVNVLNGGLGFVMTANEEIRLVMGSTFRDVGAATPPGLTAAAATASAQTAIARYAVARPSGADTLIKPAFDALEQEIAAVLHAPKLNIVPTAGGYKLAWNVIGFSRNPFGLFVSQIDANTGEVLARENKILAQTALPYTADIYPNHPVVANPDTDQLKLDAQGEPKVINADNGGDGQAAPASFIYRQSLANGATSAARHLKFSNPLSHLFTFSAIVTARVRTTTLPANGSQPGDGAGTGIPPADERFSSQTDVLSAIILGASGGLNRVNGVDYVDIPFVAKPNSFGVDGAMDTFPVSLGALPDLDLQLRDSEGHVLSSSGNLGPREFVSGAITPGNTYIYRVVGFANGPTQVNIQSKQYFPIGMAPSGSSSGSSSQLPTVTGINTFYPLQFLVNPLTKTVSLKP